MGRERKKKKRQNWNVKKTDKTFFLCTTRASQRKNRPKLIQFEQKRNVLKHEPAPNSSCNVGRGGSAGSLSFTQPLALCHTHKAKQAPLMTVLCCCCWWWWLFFFPNVFQISAKVCFFKTFYSTFLSQHTKSV